MTLMTSHETNTLLPVGDAADFVVTSEITVFDLIRDWAEARNIIKGATQHAQMVKLVEEMGELAAGIAKKNLPLVADSLGDCVVVLTILAAQNGMRLEGLIDGAYNEIKDRKGRMVEGVFVKESDLTECPDEMALVNDILSAQDIAIAEVIMASMSDKKE